MPGVDAGKLNDLVRAFRIARPEAVINCVGIIKQLDETKNPIINLSINSLLPHRLAQLCDACCARMIHVSTDCVFSGRKGNYTENDVSDAEDLYGRTKFLGEVYDAPHCVTLRTSIIGRAINSSNGLIDWFLSQNGKTIRGFRRAIYSGFTTLEMSRIMEGVLTQHPEMHGLWHVSSGPISKYDLLKMASKPFQWEGNIQPDDEVVCDRSLDSSAFREATCYRPPAWQDMLDEMASDGEPSSSKGG